MKTLENFRVEKKNVLLRVDFNLPTIDNIVTDKSRIYAIQSTLNELIRKKNKVFLLSHFGRPKGQINKKYSLEFLKDTLVQTLSLTKVFFASSCFGEVVDYQKKIMQPGDVCLLENVRFYEAEEKNDSSFAKSLAEHFDVYVNDAFSVSHRSHASIVGITQYLPSVAGYNFINEIKNLNKLIDNNKTKTKTTAIIGGSKISTKLKLLKNLIKSFDSLIIGGAMANTFLLAQGLDVGKSLIEENLVTYAKEILKDSNKYKCNIILPIDVVCSNHMKDKINIKTLDVEKIPYDQMVLDVGIKTINLIKSTLLESRIIMWNGPLGAFEFKPFDNGTNQILEVIKNNAQQLKILTIAGGGDTIASIKHQKVEQYFSYISTAGGAFLEWLEGNSLPGIKALEENNLC